MRRCLLRVSLALGVTAALAVALGGSLSPTDAQAQSPPGVIPGQYIVVFHDGVADPPGLANALVGAHGGALLHTYQHALTGFAVRFSATAAAALARNPNVAFVEPDLEAHAILHGNNFQTLPPGIDRINADQNATANIDGVPDPMNVDIAILDTGIDLDHPDLNVFYNQSFINGAATGDDDNYHGTHVAGTAAAIDNGIGVVGVAPGARLWALKVLNKNGSGSFSDIIEAIDFVTGNGQIEVVNMSLGGIGKLDSLRLAIQNGVAAGVVYVVAAGNGSRDVYGNDGTLNTSDDSIPVAYPEAATISGMVDTDGRPGGLGPSTSRGADDTFYSNTNFSRSVVAGNPVSSPGRAIDVAAPGVNVLSTYPGGLYATISGTSMSSPHVAGAAALYAAANGRATDADGVAAIRQALIDGAQPQGAWGPSNTNDPDAYHEGLLYLAGGPTNTPPTAVDDPYTVDEGGYGTIDVLSNDSDPDGDPLTITTVSQGAHGPVSQDGSAVTYTHDGSETTSDSFTYTMSDGRGGTATATVAVTVAPVNDPPTADAGPDQTVTDVDNGGNEQVTLDGAASTDPDGSITSPVWSESGVEIATGPNPTVTLSVGDHSITLIVTDDANATDTDTVLVGVAPNQSPTANAGPDQSLPDINNDGIESVTFSGSGSDPDGLIVTFEWKEGATVLGTTAIITPSLAVGPHTVTLTVTDNGGLTGSDTVVVTVTDPNTNVAPTAADDSYAVKKEQTLTVAAPGVLANDTDANGDPLTAVLGSDPSNGALTLNADGSFTYTPNAGFTGKDYFTYMANDGTAYSAPATVTINVTKGGKGGNGDSGGGSFCDSHPTHRKCL